MKILIGGDVAPINSNKEYFNNKNDFLGCLIDNHQKYDLRIINLEAPITVSEKINFKPGPNLKLDPSIIGGLLASKINLVSLANNHIGDYGEKGVLDTIKILEDNNIKTVGAGSNLTKANKPFIYMADKSLAIFSFSDTEFGMATQKNAGANPLDLCNMTLNILDVIKSVDYSIVLLHECKEYHKYPSPDLQKICQYICDLGVDVVICQHSHVIGAWEKYKKCNIFYGQGNLIFDYDNRNNNEWKNGFLIEIEFEDENYKIRQIPYIQKFPGLKKLNETLQNSFFTESRLMQENVSNKDFIKDYWQNKIKKNDSLYFSLLRGHSRYLRGLNKFINFSNLFYSKKDLVFLLNIFRSRVHREAVIKIIENKIYK